MENSEKYYSIIVDGKPADVEVGFLGDDGRPNADTKKAQIFIGETAVPNYSVVWGIQDRDPKTNQLRNGSIKYLKWGHPDGYRIEIRLLPNCSSIDLEYQRDIKKLVKLRNDDAEIPMFVGVNNFKFGTDTTKIGFLKVHYQNGSNESRDPAAQIVFYDYDSEKINSPQVLDIELRQKAELIVLKARHNNEALDILGSLFHVDIKQQPDQVFRQLIEKTVNFKHFLEVMDLHRTGYELMVNKSISLGLLDLEPVDAIFIVKDDKKDKFLDDMPADQQQKVLELVTNYYEPKYFSALQTLKAVYEKYADGVLQ